MSDTTEQKRALTPEQEAEIRYIRSGLRISKVVATRAVKTGRGDYFVGLSAAWDSTQEDAGGGTDLIDALDPGEQHSAVVGRGMTLKQAEIAGLILGLQVDLQATSHALCGGAISEPDFQNASKAMKQNYFRRLTEVVGKSSEGGK